MVGLTVSDMDSSVAFYTRILDFTKASDDEVAGAPYEALTGVFGVRLRVVRLRLGNEYLQLTQYLASPGRPAPVDSRSNDHWFQHVAIIVRDMDSAYARLRGYKVRHASTGPQLLPRTIPNAAGIRAFYFRDPDGHPLEILQFPADKGDPKWHEPTDRLFLGIDHTAIVVGDTKASLAFYRDVLGFRVAGESMNFGTEQEHLNNVQGARLHITGLRAPAGPGIEFLEYVAPRDGRAYPSDERPNDLVHWQTTLLVPDADAAAAAVRRGRFRLVTPAPVDLPDTSLGFTRGLLVRDPDGHVIQLVEHQGVVHAQH
jgi:catechol 2,3-dioxygenase-like lactoylglutathione lyase family enzyme